MAPWKRGTVHIGGDGGQNGRKTVPGERGPLDVGRGRLDRVGGGQIGRAAAQNGVMTRGAKEAPELLIVPLRSAILFPTPSTQLDLSLPGCQ